MISGLAVHQQLAVSSRDSLGWLTGNAASVITFRVSRRRRAMYCGHARLCVCLSVCPQPHAHTIARTRI